MNHNGCVISGDKMDVVSGEIAGLLSGDASSPDMSIVALQKGLNQSLKMAALFQVVKHG